MGASSGIAAGAAASRGFSLSTTSVSVGRASGMSMLEPDIGRESGTIAICAFAAVVNPRQAIRATVAAFVDISTRAFRTQDHDHRAREDPDVEPQRPALDVREVEFHPSIEARDVVSSA